MSNGNGAPDEQPPEETEGGTESTSLVGDLMRRAASPELLAAVAGAAATAIAKRASEAGAEPAEEEADESEAPQAMGGESPDETDEEAEDAERAESSDDEDGEEAEQAAFATGEPEQRDEEATAEEESPEFARATSDGDSVLSDERARIIRRAREYARELTERRVETISAIGRDEDRWRIDVEVVELPRIPPTTDVLASYELVLDDDLQLVEYRRTRRYYRNTTDEG